MNCQPHITKKAYLYLDKHRSRSASDSTPGFAISADQETSRPKPVEANRWGFTTPRFGFFRLRRFFRYIRSIFTETVDGGLLADYGPLKGPCAIEGPVELPREVPVFRV